MSLLMDALKVAGDRKQETILAQYPDVTPSRSTSLEEEVQVSIPSEQSVVPTTASTINDEHQLEWKTISLQQQNSSEQTALNDSDEWKLLLSEKLEASDDSKSELAMEKEASLLEDEFAISDFGKDEDLLAEYEELQRTIYPQNLDNHHDTIQLADESTPLAEPEHHFSESEITPLSVLIDQPIDQQVEELDWDEALKPSYPDSELDELLAISPQKNDVSPSFTLSDSSSSQPPAQRIFAAGGKSKISKRVKWLYALAVLTFIGVVGGIGGVYYKNLCDNQVFLEKIDPICAIGKTKAPLQPVKGIIEPAPTDSATPSVVATAPVPKQPTAIMPVQTSSLSEPIKKDLLLPKQETVIEQPQQESTAIKQQKLANDTNIKKNVMIPSPAKEVKLEPSIVAPTKAKKPAVAKVTPVPTTPMIKRPPPESSEAAPLLRKGTISEKNKKVSEAYQAFQQGHDGVAQKLYRDVLYQDARNRDALLGLAAIAARNGQTQQAHHYYQQILQFYPKDTLAQMGLNSVQLTQAPELKESELKSLVERLPEAPDLRFDLGNFYATQQQWSAAQQAYFDAYRLDKKQPDYAYNLAVSLDHLNQSRLALNYYQEAIKLIQNKSITSYHFDPQAVQRRIQTLVAYTHSNAVAD